MKFIFLSVLLLATSSSALSDPINSEAAAVKLATRAIHEFRLTTVSDDCGVIDVSDQPTWYEIVVRERHSQTCGGDPTTQPRLFGIRVRKRDGRLTSDVYDGVHYRLVDHALPASPKSPH